MIITVSRNRIHWFFAALAVSLVSGLLFTECLALAADSDDDWIGGGKNTGPVKSDQSLLGEKRVVYGAVVTDLKLDATNVLPYMRWSANGKFLFILERRGFLRKIKADGFVEVARLPIRRRCTCMAESRQGLLVVADGLEEIWIIDPKTLAVKKKIEVPKICYVTSSPKLNVAFAITNLHPQMTSRMTVINLLKGKVSVTLTASDFSRAARGTRLNPKDNTWMRFSTWRWPLVTPDGRYLISKSGDYLHRFRINGTKLTYDQISVKLDCAMEDRLSGISPDSKYVAVVGWQNKILKVKDLRKVILKNDPGSLLGKSTRMAFDKVSGQVYVSSGNRQVLVVGRGGKRTKAIPVSHYDDHTQQILTEPAGGKMIVLTRKGLFRVELINGNQNNPSPAALSKPMLADKKTLGDATVHRICVPHVSESYVSKSYRFVFSPDGKVLYRISPDGMLRRIEVNGFKQTHAIPLSDNVKGLALSKLGLVVAAGYHNAVLLLNPDTLMIKKRIACKDARSIRRLISSPSVTFALMEVNGVVPKKPPGDASNGQAQLALGGVSENGCLTPDGKYLVRSSWISRYRMKGTLPVLEEHGDCRTLGWSSDMQFTADSQYVLTSMKWITVDGARGRPYRNRKILNGKEGVTLHRVTDLRKPAIFIDCGDWPKIGAVCGVTKRVYLVFEANPETLVVYGFDGKKVGQYKLPEAIKRMIMCPGGGKMIVIGGKSVMWMEFPDKPGGKKADGAQE